MKGLHRKKTAQPPGNKIKFENSDEDGAGLKARLLKKSAHLKRGTSTPRIWSDKA